MALKKDDIIQEALTLLDENGLEGVTLRKLANRLNVQAPALYWHFKNKAALINDMAEAILRTEFADMPKLIDGEPWQEWLTKVLNRLRKAMLSRRDGGRIVVGAHLSMVMAEFNEAAIDTLFRSGVSLRKSRLIVLTATHYIFGFVIAEQTEAPPEGVENFDLEQFKKDHPTMVAAISEYFESGNTVEDFFNDGLQLIIGGS